MADMTGQLTTALANRYRIESHLGEGGMATVYLAHDLKHDRPVALKVLRPELAAVIGAERFLNEIKVTANLQHPHILPLHDSGDADGFLFYVMPYVEGETLRDKLDREKQFAIDEAIEITKSVAAALDYAHRHDVIHRDIKPENILIHEGQALVADFGIALAVSQAGGTRLTETGLSIGTPHYMSPEQAMGDRELDARSDVYSLGAMLYEMLAGDPPYTGSTAQAIVAKVITEKAPPVTTHRDTVPPHVAASVTKALSKLPADRFTSAAAFSEALTNPAFTLPSMAATAVAGAPEAVGMARWVRFAWPTVAAVLAGLALWGWLRPQPPMPVARYRFALPEEQALRPRFGHRIALSPDGSRLVYVGPGEGGLRLWVRERDQLDARPLPGTDNAYMPTFSPDGQHVAFLTTAPFTLKVISLAGGPPITVTDTGLGPAGASWGPDGYLFVDGVGSAGLVSVPASGGTPEPVTVVDPNGETGHAWPQVLPNGKGIVFTVWRGASNIADHDIAVLNLATGEYHVLVRGVQARYAASGHLVYVAADGALLAVPFDQDRLELSGSPTALIEGLGVRQWGSVDLALSATGKLVYVTGGSAEDPDELVWVDRDGTAEEIDPGWTGDFTTLALSPDGTRLAVSIGGSSGLDLWIKRLDEGPLSRLTFPDGADLRPAWTPDGQSVTFISERGDDRDLYVKRADGVGSAELLLDLPVPVNQGFWSAGGDWLIYRVGRNDALDIYARRAADTAAVPLVTNPQINEHTPTLSPNGRWLAYVSDESGRWELYVRPFPNVDDGRWQVSTSGGTEPVWAHSGRELFYKNAAGDLIAAEVQTAPTFGVGQQRVLFPTGAAYESFAFHPRYDVTRDDERFVMIRFRGGGEAGELILVENWFEELKAKVGN